MTTTEDDDDEGFGEFTFAPITVHSNPKINGSDHHDKIDDDWGDFVTPASFSHCETLPVKSLDPINFSSDRGADSLKNDVAQPDWAQSGIRAQWEKPKGALPLSLFGEEEKEDESGAPSLLFNGATELKKIEKKVGSELNVRDMISNLYAGSELSKVASGSGLNLDSNGLGLKRSVSNLEFNDSGLKLENWGSYGLNSESKGLDLKRTVSNFEINGSSLKLENLGSYGLNLNSKGSDLKGSVSNLSLNGSNSKINLDSNGLNSGIDEDDDGWEFKAAETKLPNGVFNFKSQHEVKPENVPMSNVDGLNSSWNVWGSNLNGLSSSVNGENKDANGFSSSLVDKSEEFGDDDEWEFKDAEPEPLSGDSNSKGNNNGPWNSEGAQQAFVFEDGSQVPTGLFAASNGMTLKPGELDFGFDFNKSSLTSGGINGSFANSELKNDSGAQVPTNLFATSNGTSQKSGQFDFAFDFSESSVAPDGISSSLSKSKQNNDNENGLDFTSVIGNVEKGETLWEFKDAFSETGSKDKGIDIKSESHRGALPLSIFGDSALETDNTSVHEDASNYNFASSGTDNIKKNQGSSVSISDLITSLYNQAEQKAPVNHLQNPSENNLDSAMKVVDSNLVDRDGDFDDESWEFKGAVSRTVDEQISVPSIGDPHVKHSTKMEPKNLIEQKDYADFYSKLEDELWFVAQCHLDNLKKAQSTAASCGEDGKLEGIDKEIQDLYDELHQDGVISKVHPENQPLSNIHLNEFIEVLQEPKFHVLEAEYKLSMRLSLAEKDWRSAIELLKHAASTSKILKLGSWEEQSSFVSTWFKMVSVCAQELRHGALIWKESLEKNVSSQLFSDPRGKQYILALGEIYRVVEVLGSSAKLYKPFMLLSYANPTGMSTLLSECFTLWSSSGLEEAVRNISDPTGFECSITPKELLESIKCIHDLDAFVLHNHVFSGQEPTCQLSLLTAGAVPDMKMVVWNGEHYFLPLANLWANLVTTNPPNLPHLYVR